MRVNEKIITKKPIKIGAIKYFTFFA